MKPGLSRLFNSREGKYIFSIILGLGLASLFRRACASRNCLVFKAPSLKSIKEQIFGFNEKCYKFAETSVSCQTDNNNIKTVDFE